MLLIQKYGLQNLIIIDMTFTRHQSNVKLDDVIGSNNQHSRYLREILTKKRCRTACLWLAVPVAFIVTFCYLNLFMHNLHTHAVTFHRYIPALWVSTCLFFSARLTAQGSKCEKDVFLPLMWPWPDRGFDLPPVSLQRLVSEIIKGTLPPSPSLQSGTGLRPQSMSG